MVDRRSLQRRAGERRADNRCESQSQIRFLKAAEPTHEVLDGTLVDVSPGGVRLLAGEALSLGERVLIEVRDAAGHCSSLTAEVVWAEPLSDGRHSAGCELRVELSRRQRLVLTGLAHAGRSRRW